MAEETDVLLNFFATLGLARDVEWLDEVACNHGCMWEWSR